MILNFDEFQKANQTGGELDDIRIKNFNIFQKKGFPSKKEESWKYTDLKTLLYNNLNKLEVLNNKKNSQYHAEWLLKNKTEIFDLIKKDLNSRDFIMIKGSNATGLHKITKILKQSN